MNQTKEVQIDYWREHIERASSNNQSLHEYSALNKISKSALYRWEKHFSDLNVDPSLVDQSIEEEPTAQTEGRTPPFSQLVVEASDMTAKIQSNSRSLPDSAWLAELIVKVIRGLS